MTIDRIRTFAELVGLAAVVLSLLLVAYEVRQSNQIAQATTTYEISRDVNQFNELGYSDDEFARLLLQLSDGSAEYSGVETLKARLLAHRFVNVWTVQEVAHQNGLMTDEQFEMTKRDVLTVTRAFPGLASHWKAVLRTQPDLRGSDVLESLVGAHSE